MMDSSFNQIQLRHGYSPQLWKIISNLIADRYVFIVLYTTGLSWLDEIYKNTTVTVTLVVDCLRYNTYRT